MKQTSAKAKLEASLLKIWYDGQKPSASNAVVLNLLEGIYKALRSLSGQDRKSLGSKAPTKPPVLVVGNLIAGGAGKTPIVMAVCQALRARGKSVGIVSRGYGRSSAKPFLIDPAQPMPSAREVGDEPLFLATQTGCPLAVGSDRNAALQLLLDQFPHTDLVVADDGLQHHRLKRQLEWVVFDARGQGNGRLLPAGPLREPVSRLAHVDAVIASNIGLAQLQQSLKLGAEANWYEVSVNLSGFRNQQTREFLTPTEANQLWQTKTIAAFSGIADPNKLFNALKKHGLVPTAQLGLPDHFDYPSDFCTQFDQSILITSGKDAVKLRELNPRLWVAEISVDLPSALIKSLEDSIGSTTD